MTKNEETLKNVAAIAEFCFGLIAPVIQGLFPDATATAYYKRIAEKICLRHGRKNRMV